MKNLIRYYLAIFFRRIHYFLAIFGLVTLASITFARLLPPVYVSEARLVVESGQIPDELAAQTVTTAASEQLQVVQLRLMARSNLLDTARRLKVFPNASELTADEIVSSMRKNIHIYSHAPRDQAAVMTIGFESESGVTAAAVVNEFVTSVLKNNVEIRTERASETLDFFEKEVQRLQENLSKQSAIILAFKNDHSDALPDSLSYRLTQQSLQQERSAAIQRQVIELIDQRRRLVLVFESTGQTGSLRTETLSPEQRQLASLEADLRQALVIFSPNNPKIVLLKAQIAQLKPVVASQLSLKTGVAEAGPTSILDLQLAELDARTGLLGEQSKLIENELSELKSSLERTPANDIALRTLERDHDNIQRQYDVAVDRLAKAATGERIELLSKGQRISIIESATVPSKPTKPNRTVIALGGSAIGAGLGLALIVFLEMIGGAIRRPQDITNKLGITPIATIPYVRTPMESVVRKAIFAGVFGVIVIGIPALLFALHTYYLPLDLIFSRIASKLGSFI